MRYLFLVSLLVSIQTYGQITVTDADMPIVDDTFRISVTQNNWSLDPTPAGAGLTWDFSPMIPMTQRVDTMSPVNQTPTAYQFFFNNGFLYPDYVADFGYPGQDFDVFGFLTFSNVYDYYRADPDSYKHLGFGANINGIPTPVRHDSIDDVYQFPLNYGDEDSSYMEYQITIPNIGTYRQEKWTYSEVEGWGTLITPFGSFNTLKLRREIDITDSLYLDTLGFGNTATRPTSTEYVWLGQGSGVPLMKVTMGPTGNVASIEYQDSVRSTFLSVDEVFDFSMDVFPNPASDHITIETDQPIDAIYLYSSTGKLIVQRPVQGLSRLQMNVRDVAAGMYFLSIETPEGQSVRKIFIE